MNSLSPINYKEKHRSHWFVVAAVCIGAFMAALDASIINVALPNLEQQFMVKHLPVFQAGLILTAIPIGMTISTPISGIMSDHRGPGIPSVIGLTMATIGAFLLFLIDITGTYILTCVGLLLVGSGIGMFTPPNNSHVMGNVPKSVLGITGGILNMSRTFGMSLGITLGGLTYQFFLKLYGNNDLSRLVITFRSAYFTFAVFSLLALFINYKNYKDEFKNMGGYHSKQVEVNKRKCKWYVLKKNAVFRYR